MATLTTIDGILKDNYGELVEQLNNEVFMLSQIEKNTNSMDADGRRAVHAIHTGRNAGLGARAEGGTLPTAGSQAYKAVPVPLRFLYGTVSLTGQTIKLANSNNGAFANAMEKEMSGLQADWRKDVGRQVWGTSNGVVATCGTTTTSTTVVLTALTTPTQMRQLYNDGGMIVDIGTVATPTSVASARTITAVSDTTYGSYTATISGATVSTTDGTHFLFRSGNGGASTNTGLTGDGQLELTGLQTIVDNADTLHTLTVASNPTWKAQEYSNSGTLREVSEPMITNGLMQSQIKGGNVQLLVTAEGVHLRISSLLTSLKRAMNTVKLPGGHIGIEWSSPNVNQPGGQSTALVVDQDCPGNALYGIDPSSLVLYEAAPVGWIDDDGSILHTNALSGGTDVFSAGLRFFGEQACYRRNVNFKITDLTESLF